MNPIGQAIICEVVPENERGWAFGLLGSVNSACVMVVGFMATAMSTHVYLGLQGLRREVIEPLNNTNAIAR
eukprot:1307574-Amphidinium_carterae.1